MVGEMLEAVEEARSSLRARLFEPDESPLWTAVAKDLTAPGERVTSELEADWVAVRAFIVERGGRLPALALIFVLAWLGALGLGRSIAARRETGGEIEDSSRVFSRPIALAEAGIEIPFPQRDLHLRSVDAAAARRLAQEEDAT